MCIIDMRGPDIILREGFDEDGAKVNKRRKKGNMQNVPGESSLVGSMKWVVAGMGPGELNSPGNAQYGHAYTTDSSPRPRLIVSYIKGYGHLLGRFVGLISV
jgi:syntaxin-binding protein 5